MNVIIGIFTGIGALIVFLILIYVLWWIYDEIVERIKESSEQRKCKHNFIFELPLKHKKGYVRICKGCLKYIKCDSNGNLN